MMRRKCLKHGQWFVLMLLMVVAGCASTARRVSKNPQGKNFAEVLDWALGPRTLAAEGRSMDAYLLRMRMDEPLATTKPEDAPYLKITSFLPLLSENGSFLVVIDGKIHVREGLRANSASQSHRRSVEEERHRK